MIDQISVNEVVFEGEVKEETLSDGLTRGRFVEKGGFSHPRKVSLHLDQDVMKCNIKILRLYCYP